ncbi:MAG: aromatic amino acid lyase, partial [Thermodesulfobacteriota bacterium]
MEAPPIHPEMKRRIRLSAEYGVSEQGISFGNGWTCIRGISPYGSEARNTTMNRICISGNNLSIDHVIAVVHGAPVTLDPAAVSVMERSRRAVVDLVQAGTVAYGITTGFGRFKDCIISAEQTAELQINLVRSHAVGVGEPLSSRHVRSLMLARTNTLAMGHSGVRPCVVQRLIDFLNRGIHPRIPSQGSLGASGDLAPLAHMALVLIGEGEADVGGKLLTGAEVHQQAGLEPLKLEAKEGLALLNGTAFMVGLGALAVSRASHLVETADIAAAMTLEALHGTDRAYDERVHALRPHPRQIECAAFLRRLLEGSGLLRKDDPNNVQDPYTLRCVPQVHGAVRDAVAYARWVIEIEL